MSEKNIEKAAFPLYSVATRDEPSQLLGWITVDTYQNFGETFLTTEAQEEIEKARMKFKCECGGWFVERSLDDDWNDKRTCKCGKRIKTPCI